ncbi:hypothetical protein WA158_002345 [Blastocystis sp. Blastoise]
MNQSYPLKELCKFDTLFHVDKNTSDLIPRFYQLDETTQQQVLSSIICFENLYSISDIIEFYNVCSSFSEKHDYQYIFKTIYQKYLNDNDKSSFYRQNNSVYNEQDEIYVDSYTHYYIPYEYININDKEENETINQNSSINISLEISNTQEDSQKSEMTTNIKDMVDKYIHYCEDNSDTKEDFNQLYQIIVQQSDLYSQYFPLLQIQNWSEDKIYEYKELLFIPSLSEQQLQLLMDKILMEKIQMCTTLVSRSLFLILNYSYTYNPSYFISSFFIPLVMSPQPSSIIQELILRTIKECIQQNMIEYFIQQYISLSIPQTLFSLQILSALFNKATISTPTIIHELCIYLQKGSYLSIFQNDFQFYKLLLLFLKKYSKNLSNEKEIFLDIMKRCTKFIEKPLLKFIQSL